MLKFPVNAAMRYQIIYSNKISYVRTPNSQRATLTIHPKDRYTIFLLFDSGKTL
jgi:hypothetical protein